MVGEVSDKLKKANSFLGQHEIMDVVSRIQNILFINYILIFQKCKSKHKCKDFLHKVWFMIWQTEFNEPKLFRIVYDLNSFWINWSSRAYLYCLVNQWFCNRNQSTERNEVLSIANLSCKSVKNKNQFYQKPSSKAKSSITTFYK